MKTRNLTEGSPVKLIMAVALPLMVGNVFQQLYTVVDARIVGGFVGVSALAAVGAADWFNWLFLGLIQGLAQGFAIPMAHAFGAKDHASLRKSVGNAIILAAVLILVITVAALLLISPVLDLLGTPDDIKPMSVSYLTVLFAAFPVVMTYNLMAGILRSLGDGKSPLYAMVIAAAVNIGLDLLFVCVFYWGVTGAAIATVIAQVCSCLFCVFRLAKLDFIRPSKSDMKPEKEMCVRLLRLGLPIAAQNGIIGVGGMVLQSIVNDMGVAFIAGYTATNKLYGVLETAAVSYGYAVSAYTGQNLGAGKIDRIRRGVRAANAVGIVTAAVIALAMFFVGKPILAGFISGTPQEVEEAVKVACEYLYLMSACLAILYILHIFRSALQGIGNALMPMLSGIAELIMRVGVALLLTSVIGYWGIFFAEVLAWLGADLILVTSYFVNIKRLK